jgi:hypothetical protein
MFRHLQAIVSLDQIVSERAKDNLRARQVILTDVVVEDVLGDLAFLVGQNGKTVPVVLFGELTGRQHPEAVTLRAFARPLLEERVRTRWYSLLAAVAAGIAGTIAIVKRKQDTLIGIVASVALVPAAAAGGITLYAGDPGRAIGGALLLFVNVFVIISRGLLVLLVIRPTQTGTGNGEEENKL